jgi:hypothetical protein
MLDPVACGAMRATPQPVAALSALMSLCVLLAAAGKGHVPRRATLASPESSGDCHATASAPTAPVEPAARTRPDARAVDSDAASLKQPADGDAADPQRSVEGEHTVPGAGPYMLHGRRETLICKIDRNEQVILLDGPQWRRYPSHIVVRVLSAPRPQGGEHP